MALGCQLVGKSSKIFKLKWCESFRLMASNFVNLKVPFAPTVDGIEDDSRTVTDNIHNCWAHGLCRYIRKIMDDAVDFFTFQIP